MAKALESKTTAAPQDAEIAYTSGNMRFSREDWQVLSNDVYQSINASLSERSALEQNLKDWTDLYEMRVDETDWPWVDASNVFIPVIPAQLDTAVAYILGKVFVPRFYIVTGNTPEATQSAHDVERYYNAELVRQRGHTTWYDQYMSWLHLAFRDGTSIMEVLWRKTTTKRKVVTFVPEDNDGVPVIDMNTGKPKMTRKIDEVETVDYDDCELQPLLLKDFLLIPAEATSIEQAVGVARALWLYESDLMAMAKTSKNPDGILDPYWIEYALNYVPTGTSDVASDRQGSEDKQIGSQLVPGLAQGAQTSKYFANRGPIKVWRVHTKQYDLNGDHVAEENIFFLHELSQMLLGVTDYEYIVPSRPFFSFSPYPRPDRFYGYSICERLAPIQAEVNAMYNARNNLIDLMLTPPLLYQAGDELNDQEQSWGPGVKWEVTDPQKSVKWMEFPQVPLASFQNETLLNSYVDKLTGAAAPAMGAQSSGRRTASEIKTQMASTTTRNDAVALRLRIVCRAIFNFVHKLKLQYISEDPDFSAEGNKFVIPKEILAKDYQLDIAGSSDPLDVSTRRQENMSLFELLMNIPFIQQDQMKSYNVVRMMLESFNRPDVAQMIGTEEEAQQRQQQMEQAQQKQDQMNQMLLQHEMQTGQHIQPPGQPPQGAQHGTPPKH